MSPTPTPPTPGVIFDGARGHAAVTGLMIEYAVEFGYHLTPDERVTLDALANGQRVTPDAGELLDELATDATDWLNGEVAATDHSFAWSGGDFLYQPDNPTERG